MQQARKRRWGLSCLAVAALLLAPASWAQGTAGETPGEPGDLPVVHVPTEPDELPDRPGLDYAVNGLLQGDALASSDVDDSLSKSSELRRARVSLLLRYNLDWRFKASADFANAPNLREVSLEYRGFGPVSIEAGRLVEPFGVLSGSSTSMGLMERPLAEGLAPGYGLGVAGNASGERWGVTLGVFESTKNSVLEGGREERAITLRPTWALLKKENQAIHLGLEASYRETKGDTLQFVAIPESVLLYGLNVNSSQLFNGSDPGKKNRYQLFGAELGLMFGPVLILTEGTFAHLQDAVALNGNFGGFNFNYTSDAYFTGYYLEVDCALTGERRDYSVRRGAFSGIDPEHSVLKGSAGAFELAGRVGGIDLQDGNLGGESGLAASLGLNWFPEEHTRVTLEGLVIEKTDGAGNDAHASAVQLRGQVLFSAP